MKKKVLFFLVFAMLFCGCLIPVLEFEETETTTKEDSVEKTEQEHDVKKSETNLDYLRSNIIEDDYYGKVLIAYFDFENVSNENKQFSYTYDVKAFQNGVEIDDARFINNEFCDNSSKEIQPNTKITVACSFKYEETDSSVILEVYPWISFNNEKLMEIEIKPE